MGRAASAISATIDDRFSVPDTIFFGIGAQKSGTSWLNYFLGTHPDVATPAIKEQNYWRMVERGGGPGRIIESYREILEAPDMPASVLTLDTPDARRVQCARFSLRAADSPVAPHSDYADAIFAGEPAPVCKAAGEISPSYATLKAATFEQMTSVARNVRFLFLMRDPLDRLEAGLRHSLKRAPQPVSQADFDAMVGGVIEGKRRSTLVMSQYDRTITRLEKAAGPDRIGYFFFETLFHQGVVDQICDFLGISRQNADFDRVVNGGGVKHLGYRDDQRRSVAALLAPTYRALRKKFGAAIPAAWEASEALALAAEADL